MKALKILLLISVLMACTNLSADSLKPKFFSDYFTGLDTKQITDYASSKLNYDLTSSKNKNIHFSSCTQVDATKDQDILMSEYHLLTMLRLNCKALKMYTLANKANITFLTELLADKDISNLPATAYPYVNNEDKNSRISGKLKSYQKKLITKVSTDGSIEVETETDNLIYNIIAVGDFNGDHIQDALIRIDWHVINAFGKGSKLVLITKKSSAGSFEEINFN